MERLTKKLHDGTPWYNHTVDKPVSNEEVLERLFMYEESGLDPNSVIELAAAKHHNRLLIQPCALYGAIYIVVEKLSRGQKPTLYRYIKKSKLMPSNLFRVAMDYGKTVFLTLEEAQDAKERMDKNG